MINTYTLRVDATYPANSAYSGLEFTTYYHNMSVVGVKRYVEFYRENYDNLAYVITSNEGANNNVECLL